MSRRAKPVTIVVPIYGDLASLLRCIASLKQTVDTGVHSVLLVDDRGPDSDAIAAAVAESIAGLTGFRLERNDANLGFVGTCNRAAFELDLTGNDLLFLNSDTETTNGFLEELVDVLALSPNHGAVCPRSNNATIASLPFRLADPSAGRPFERTRQVHAALKDQLPRYSISPVAMGFCILVRRDLVERFGLFDPVFAPGYGEENDFCLRIGEHGFLSVIANRALVFHEGSRSFTGLRRDIVRARHDAIVARRHPQFRPSVARYLGTVADVADLFADVLVPSDRIPSVLVLRGGAVDAGVVEALGALASRHVIRVRTVRCGSRAARAVSGVYNLAIVPDEMSSLDRRVADRSAARWLLVRDSDTRVALADQASVEAAIGDALGLPVDLAQLRERHHEYSSIAGEPVPGSRRVRQRFVDRIPTVAVAGQWLLLGVARRIRSGR